MKGARTLTIEECKQIVTNKWKRLRRLHKLKQLFKNFKPIR